MVKRAVSISLGSSKRDKTAQVQLLGETVSIERIGTDGDMEKAARLYQELDGVADAFGVGGADLGLMVDGKWHPLYSVHKMVRYVQKTPLVDGSGLKNTLETQAAPVLEASLGAYLDRAGRRALLTAGADRWGMSISFAQAGYECVFADLMFGLGLPIPLRSLASLKRFAALLMPIAGRLPFEWIYPTGEKQEKRTPKWESFYQWATVIAGDCHYIKRHMPERLDGKLIVTNTTTEADVAAFRQAGVKALLTTTPVLDGRSFGTNMMEAALIAASGKGRVLTQAELAGMLAELNFQPQLQELN
jgi:hypothetical protein